MIFVIYIYNWIHIFSVITILNRTNEIISITNINDETSAPLVSQMCWSSPVNLCVCALCVCVHLQLNTCVHLSPPVIMQLCAECVCIVMPRGRSVHAFKRHLSSTQPASTVWCSENRTPGDAETVNFCYFPPSTHLFWYTPLYCHGGNLWVRFWLV